MPTVRFGNFVGASARCFRGVFYISARQRHKDKPGDLWEACSIPLESEKADGSRTVPRLHRRGGQLVPAYWKLSECASQSEADLPSNLPLKGRSCQRCRS